MDRMRRLLLGGAAASIGLSGWRAQAARLGDWEVMTLSDGHLTLPASFIFAPMPEEELEPIRAAYRLSGETLTPPCNVTLLRRGDQTILFDCGSGPAFQTSAGRLIDALAAAGVDPLDVTHLIFTHGHPDHLWGVLDDFDDPVFSEAIHLMGRVERDYWLDPNTPAEIGQERASFAVGAARRLEMLNDRIEVFEDGAELLPGIAARASYGHSPGHMSFEIISGTESLMILGDAISNHHVAFAKPDWPSGSDQDTALAAQTRQSLLDQVSAAQMTVIGFHLPSGGIGRVARDADAFRFIPYDL